MGRLCGKPEEETATIYEVALLALRDASMRGLVADKCDLSDEYLDELEAKLGRAQRSA